MNAGSFVIGRIGGIELRLHWSWVIILALATVVFGSTELPLRYPSMPPLAFWAIGLVTAFLLLGSALLHEMAHLVVALRNGLAGGDLNVQLLGGTYILELRPATAGQQFRLAVAGPAVSLVLGCALALVAVATEQMSDPVALLSYPAIVLSLFNLFIGVVNLIPGYPLDGGSIVRSIVWRYSGVEARATQAAARVGRYLGYGLVSVGVAVLVTVDMWMGVFIGLGGWLLAAGGATMERRETLRSLVAHLRVRDAIERELGRVPAQLTLDTFAPDYLSLPGQAVLVERAGQPAGLIGTLQAKRLRRSWSTTHAGDAMVPLDRVPVVAPEAELWPVLEELERRRLDALVVRPVPAPERPTEADAEETADADGMALGGEATMPGEGAAGAEGGVAAADGAEATVQDEGAEGEAGERPAIAFVTRRSAARAVHTLAQQQASVAIALRAMSQRPAARFPWSRGRNGDGPAPGGGTGRGDGGTGRGDGDAGRGDGDEGAQ